MATWKRTPRGGMRRPVLLEVTVLERLPSGYVLIERTRRHRVIRELVKASSLLG